MNKNSEQSFYWGLHMQGKFCLRYTQLPIILFMNYDISLVSNKNVCTVNCIEIIVINDNGNIT